VFVVCVVGKLLYSSIMAIVAQYKDFQKSQESKPLLRTALQTAKFFTETQSLPCIYYSK